MAKLLTVVDVEARMKLVLQFFGNDTTRFAIHLGNHLNKNLKRYRSQKGEQDKDAVKQGAEKKTEKITTSLEKCSSLGEDSNALAKELTFAFEKDSNFDLLALLKSTATGSITTNQLVEAQNVRRASSLGTLSATITSGDGRRLTGFEKKSISYGGCC